MKDIYIFSGLGADERIFKHMDFSGFNSTFIKWMQPSCNETIEAYAKRISLQIKKDNPTLIGISFGGLMAVEVSKLIQTEKVIQIASVPTKYEIPFIYRLAGKLGLHKLLPSKILTNANFLTHWFFGTESKADKELLEEILKETDPTFLKWAIDKIVKWQNTIRLENLIQIHGTNDRILPYKRKSKALIVKNGGHFMTVNKANELTELVRKELLESTFL